MSDIRCGYCWEPFPVENYNLDGGAACRRCGQVVQAYVFPARWESRAGAMPERVVAAEESGCFYHPANRAAVICDSCGRFLCTLCDLEVGGRHLCPGCLESGLAKREVTAFEKQRFRYDTCALALATLPVLLIWVPVITAPIALYLAVKHWKTPLSLVPRSRWKLALAGALGLVQILAILGLIGFAVWNLSRGPRLD